MKNIFRTTIVLFIICISIISCSSDDDNGDVITLTFSHYQTVSFIGFSISPVLLPVSIENGDTTSPAYYRFVEGFEYEPGFDYELSVLKSTIEDPPADGSSIRYELLDVMAISE
jgi:hypothetical protein